MDCVQMPCLHTAHLHMRNPQEKELVFALQNHARLALQLSKHLDEAKKAAALAERSPIVYDVHDPLAQFSRKAFMCSL